MNAEGKAAATRVTCDYCEQWFDPASPGAVHDEEDGIESEFCSAQCADEQEAMIKAMAARSTLSAEKRLAAIHDRWAAAWARWNSLEPIQVSPDDDNAWCDECGKFLDGEAALTTRDEYGRPTLLCSRACATLHTVGIAELC